MMDFPKHHIMHISHNDHRSNYSSVEEEILNREFTFKNNEHRQRCIDTDELWELQWYPKTPVSFYLIAAPTWQELLEFAKAVEDEAE